jgi:hypothetical protein
MTKQKVRSEPLRRYAKMVFRTIRKSKTADAWGEAMAQYHDVCNYAAAAWAGILPARRNGYRAIKGR